MESGDLNHWRHSGMVAGPDPESRDSGFDAWHRLGMTWKNLTSGGRGIIAAPMTIAATMTIARRRRIIAVWADVCV
jgi:hypothetical protein